MKRMYFVALLGILLYPCRKQDTIVAPQGHGYLSVVEHALQDSLTEKHYSTLDFNNAITSAVGSVNLYFVRIPLKGQSVSNTFLLIKTNETGNVLKGRFVSITKDSSQKLSFTGRISYSSLTKASISSTSFNNGRANVDTQTDIAPEPVVKEAIYRQW